MPCACTGRQCTMQSDMLCCATKLYGIGVTCHGVTCHLTCPAACWQPGRLEARLTPSLLRSVRAVLIARATRTAPYPLASIMAKRESR